MSHGYEFINPIVNKIFLFVNVFVNPFSTQILFQQFAAVDEVGRGWNLNLVIVFLLVLFYHSHIFFDAWVQLLFCVALKLFQTQFFGFFFA